MDRDCITFRLNGLALDVRDVSPTTTLLGWLRRERRLVGSKEGCGEGDCGACTVIVARAVRGAVTFRAVNACILLMPMLEGTSVTTIEGLGMLGDGGLHPCQAAMVREHGSQCGFCTPGFVMSMAADRLERRGGSVDALLAGNLCRCTGYGPIVAAAEAVRAEVLSARELAWRRDETAAVLALRHGEDVLLQGGDGIAFSAGTLRSACAFLADNAGATTVVSGATDVGLWVTKQHRQFRRALFLNRVSELDSIEHNGAMLRLGAGVTYMDAETALSEMTPAFGALLARIGGVQVRNSGTIGGNIANGSPIGDMAPCLIALGADVRLRSAAGERSMALEAFFVRYGMQARAPDELVVGIDVPRPERGNIVQFHKVSKRFDSDITAVLGAFWIAISGNVVSAARLAYGGMAGTPMRAKAAEAALTGRVFDEAAVRDAVAALAMDFEPISDLRASADYRMKVAGNLLWRVFETHATPDGVAELHAKLPAGGAS